MLNKHVHYRLRNNGFGIIGFNEWYIVFSQIIKVIILDFYVIILKNDVRWKPIVYTFWIDFYFIFKLMVRRFKSCEEVL